MTSDGGAVATYGFRRQFLATAEEILRGILERSEDVTDLAIVIEPGRVELAGTDVADDDIVDFAIERASAIVRRVQVKSARVPSGMNPMRYSDAAAIFRRLGTGAHEALILTNKPLAKQTARRLTWPTNQEICSEQDFLPVELRGLEPLDSVPVNASNSHFDLFRSISAQFVTCDFPLGVLTASTCRTAP
jgi:hypothetical protein